MGIEIKLFIRDKILFSLIHLLLKLAYNLTPYECGRIYVCYPLIKSSDDFYKFFKVTENIK